MGPALCYGVTGKSGRAIVKGSETIMSKTLARVSISELTPADTLVNGQHLVSRQQVARGTFYVQWSDGHDGDVRPDMAYVVIRGK